MPKAIPHTEAQINIAKSNKLAIPTTNNLDAPSAATRASYRSIYSESTLQSSQQLSQIACPLTLVSIA